LLWNSVEAVVSGLKVKVAYLGHIKNMLGNKHEEEVEVQEGASVADLLMTLSNEYGEPFKKAIYEKDGTDMKPNFMATVNGYLLNQLQGVKTKLKQGDNVIIMPVVSGG
jgi:molybdopterin synthase sulfur carrier subunit